MDQLQSMRVFVEVVDSGSFTKAAMVTGISQATVSSHVSHLEKRLGTRLLDRTTRSVRLTDEGTSYYAICQRVLSEIDDAEAMLSQTGTAPRGLLRVDVTVALACRLIAPVLPEFCARYPDVSIELHHTGHLFDVQHESFDVLFRVGAPENSDLVAKPVSPMRMAIAASPAYLERHGEPRHPLDLLEHDCIGYVDTMTRKKSEWVLEQGAERHVLSVGGHLTCNEGESRISAAIEGMGLVLTPAYELREPVREGKLKIVLPDWTTPPSCFYVAYPANRYLSAKVRAFVNFMLEIYPPAKALDLNWAGEGQGIER